MAFTNRIIQLKTSDILIDRATRQRSDLTPDSVIDLAYSIARSQWIAPILVDKETNHVIAGERRLTAVKVLNDIMNGDYSSFTYPDKVRLKLARVSTCNIDSWENWTKIPTQLGTSLTEQDLATYEFIENIHRKGLNWADQAKAIYVIHAHGLATEKGWNSEKTGNLLGLDRSTIAKNVKLWRFAVAEEVDPKVLTIIKESTSIISALQTIERFTSRRSDDIVALTSKAMTAKPKSDIDISAKPGPKLTPGTDLSNDSDFELVEDPDYEFEDIPPRISVGSRLIQQADFNTWAEDYRGEPFNFIHCDFPYGINFNKGEQAPRAVSRVNNDFNDSPELYWQLLETLVKHQDKLIAPSAHIMFWFSQNLRRETEDFFAKHFPQATVQSHLMIWHCSDNGGILPDHQRYGRRTYETALLITFGDRFIKEARALSFSSEREKSTRIHRSQKPLAVLDHFMSMFVDDASSVLDPTAGSGTSLITAKRLGAKRIVGLELNPEAYDDSVNFIDHELNKIEVTL